MAHAYDFSTNVVPGQDEREAGYWRDVGTIDAYYSANMDLIAPHPVFNLYNDRWPVYTHRGAEPPAKVSRGPGGEPSHVDGSLLCEGSIISGAHVERSIVAPGVYVDHDAHVTDSILFPGVRVGPGARSTGASSIRTSTCPSGTASGSTPAPTTSASPSASPGSR